MRVNRIQPFEYQSNNSIGTPGVNDGGHRKKKKTSQNSIFFASFERKLRKEKNSFQSMKIHKFLLKNHDKNGKYCQKGKKLSILVPIY